LSRYNPAGHGRGLGWLPQDYRRWIDGIFSFRIADFDSMRLCYFMLAVGLLGCLQRPASCPAVTDPEFTTAAVLGLTPAQLEFPAQSNGRGWGNQRVQVAPRYWVEVSIDITSRGNGLLYVHDERGECLRTRIFDEHQEDDVWKQIEGGMFAYEFSDDDGDGELELRVSGNVELYDELGIISTYEYRERWDRSWSGARRWYLAGTYEEPHETTREEPEEGYPPHTGICDLGMDVSGRTWRVHTTREVGSWDYLCKVCCDGTEKRTLEITSRWDPEFALKSAGVASFLVVQHEGIRGTGVSSTWAAWYHLGNEVRFAIGYYGSGYLSGWGQPFDRDVGVSAELIETADLRLVLTANIDVSCDACLEDDSTFGPAPTDDADGGHMFNAKATAAYRWDAAEEKFIVLDKERADAVDGVMMGASDYLVQHFPSELQAYTARHTGKCAPWLRWLRSKCDVEANRLFVEGLIARDS
jgi:hypothetical protein